MTVAGSPAAARHRTDRLGLLRAELARRGVDGFLVPRADEHQGEYVPPSAERLAWLTGFTGSAGSAAVLAGSAALFVDGRYTLQAAAEVDGAAFAVVHSAETSVADWIAKSLPPKAKLGFDPWLHAPADVERLGAACGRAGGTLVACDTNPLDAVWHDRPPPPTGPVVAHPLAFAGRESADKRGAVAETVRRAGLGAFVLAAPDSIAWLLNIRGADVPYAPMPLAFAILHADARVELFLAHPKRTPGLADHLGPAVELAEPAQLGGALDRLGGARAAVGLDGAGTPVWIRDRLRAAGAEARIEDDPCALPKACKNPIELAGIRAAHRRDGAALCRFLAWFAAEAPAGRLTEIAAADRLEAFRREGEHFRGLSFPTIAGAGPNGAIVHYRASEQSNRPVAPGLFLLDSGAQYLDGTTDVTRTLAVGAPAAEMRDRFTRVLKGHIALATARFPFGTTGSQLDLLARAPLWAAGLDYDHGTGHGVGCYLSVHEGPHRISKLPNRVALQPGMIVSDEPGYYRSGAWGIRIENLVAVTALPAPPGAERELLGFETLTLAPIDRTLVDPALLNEGEAAWLDAYHRRVRETVGPLVDSATAAWLAQATRPIA